MLELPSVPRSADRLSRLLVDLPAVVLAELVTKNPDAVVEMREWAAVLHDAVRRCHLGYEARQVVAEQWILIDRARRNPQNAGEARAATKNIDPHNIFRLVDPNADDTIIADPQRPDWFQAYKAAKRLP